MEVEIATTPRAQVGDTFAAHLGHRTRLCPALHRQRGLPIEGSDHTGGPEGVLGHGDVHLSVQIVTIADEIRVVLNDDLHEEVARRSATWTSRTPVRSNRAS